MKIIVYTCLFLSCHFAFSQQTQIRTKIASGNDDVEVSTQFYATSSDLELGGFDAANLGKQYVALRFQNVALPANAQISRAYIQFTVKATKVISASVAIKCQRGNAVAYNAIENLQLRPYALPIVTWNPPAWTVDAESGANQQTPNLSAQIQAAIASGWASGNALSFILDGNGTQDNILNARSYETLPTHAGVAELVIDYSTGGGNPCSPDVTPPVFSNCPTDINASTTGTSAIVAWSTPSVSDNCTVTEIPLTISSSPTAGLGNGSTFPIGTTTISYNAKDAANNSAIPCVFRVTVSQNTGGSTLRVPISNGNDDVEISTQFYPTSSDLELGGFDADNLGKQYVALRFQNVTLPANAQISRAYIQFTVKDTKILTANVSIRCQQGNAAAYSATENLLSRTYVSSTATWNPPAWTVAAESGVNQQTTNLSAQVQAAIASGWVSGNALSFILTGNALEGNILNARSYENLPTHAGAPELVIEYTTGTNPCTNDIVAPVFSNCPANISLTTTTTSAVATWTVPTVTDNCTTTITPSVLTTPTAGLNQGSAFPVGVTTVTYNATDAANNVAVPCRFTVTVTNNNPCSADVVKPVFTNCPANITVTTLNKTQVVTWTAPTVTDNCTTNIVPTITSSPTAGLVSGSAFPIDVTTITYSARDAANNVAVPCTFTVTVNGGTTNTNTLFINEVSPQGTIAIPSDWIELYNSSTSAVSLNDVYISNKKTTPFKFQLKNLVIPANGFITLLADNDTLVSNLHINFKVSASGEKIYLHRNNNGTAEEIAFFETPLSPFEEDNVTFGGLVEGQLPPAPTALTKFLGGTPNEPNAGGIRYIKASNSLPRGILSAPATATLSAPAGTTIRYTTNNTFPSRTNGTIYTQPIPITTTTVLKVLAYSANSESKMEAFTYIFPVKGPELTFPNLVTDAEYESGMKLFPIVSLSTNLDSIDSRIEKLSTFEYINKFGENASVGALCGVNGYGNDSYIFSDQRNLRIKFKNQYGYGNLEYPIFKREPEDTYNPVTKFDVLDLKIGQDGPNADGFGMTMASQSLYSKTMREMGNVDLHTQYAHAFVNGKYWGIYTLKEHWDEHFGEAYFGGNKDFYDEIDEEAGWNVGSVHVNSEGVPQGTITNWNAMKVAAADTDLQTVKNYLNVKQYIDLMLNVMMFDAQWEFRAIADRNLKATKFIFENHDTDGAMIKGIDDYTTNHDFKWIDDIDHHEVLYGPGAIFGVLYRGNKEFKTLVRDRVYETMQLPNGALTVNRITAKLSELRSILKPAFNMELARFNKTFYNDNPYFDQEYNANIAYLPTRFTFTLNKWLENGLKHTLLPVIFNQPSGTTVTTPVLATNPNNIGVIYYTLDGSDPMGNDGEISLKAKLYTNRLALNVGVNNVVARVYFNTEFGPKTTATYTSATAVFALQSANILNATGRLDGQKVAINWLTKTTQEADYFKVEKLNEKGEFEAIETVNAKYSNNRDGVESYISLDENPISGDNYYRVVLFSDILKAPQYSELIKVKYSAGDIYNISPNPSSEFVDIDLKSVEGKAVTLTIFNNIGTPVFTEKVDKASVTKRLDISQLTVGQYFIAIQPQGKRVMIKKLGVVR